LNLSELDLDTLLKLKHSQSQLGQDIFVLDFTDFKVGGTFLEIGATDGVALSNTYILEKCFGWTGFLCEPARGWREQLIKNRTSTLVFDAIWNVSGATLDFKETLQKEFSTISHFSDLDTLSRFRSDGSHYPVNTLSLADLVISHGIPNDLDYLSLDTEGSEFDIIENIDFELFHPKVITIEHNYTKNRERIFTLLTSFGYKRKFEGLSRWDDWYTA
jgi:FkbM family methyltransferase